MITLCDKCRYRQEKLDPEGCFKQVSTTGFLGRLWVWICGCGRYKIANSWRVK